MYMYKLNGMYVVLCVKHPCCFNRSTNIVVPEMLYTYKTTLDKEEIILDILDTATQVDRLNFLRSNRTFH